MDNLIKRATDIILSVLGLVVFLPLMLLLAVYIKLESNGPVFYKGLRVGKGRIPFRMIKFRSMIVHADIIGGPSTSDNDPRLTRVGEWMRKYKLDELPQLINVFRGEMSFVGPRPEVVSEVKSYATEWDVIFTVRPGITDLSSIEFRNEGEIIAKSGIEDTHEAYRSIIQPKKLKLQRRYVQNRSFLLDMKIMLRTVFAVVAN